MRPSSRVCRLLFVLAACLAAAALPAATYLPGPDAAILARASVIVRAEVLDRTVRVERRGTEELPYTIVTLRRLEAFKGETEETFEVVAPGGVVEGRAWWLPGTPAFEPGQEVVLLLRALAGRPGEYALTELGLSKFDLVYDETGRRFAVRPAFSRSEDLEVSQKTALRTPEAIEMEASVPARDADSFLATLRALQSAAPLPETLWASPTGKLDGPASRRTPHWVNIGGVEPGDCGGQACLFRWFWDTGASPNAVVHVTGTQTNLTNDESQCGTNATCDVQNVVDKWHGVAGTDVRISGVVATGNIDVQLDAATSFDGVTWTTPFGCTGQNVIGLGGPSPSSGPRTFKGGTTYYAPPGGTVSMRRSTCGTGYSAKTFRSGVLHETGHVLGLGHPDQDSSVSSQTTSAQWDVAVMRSVIAASKPDTPQADDIQAMQFYYGTAAPGMMPAANFSFSPSTPAAGAAVAFTDTSTGSPTGWSWDFGDPTSGTSNASRDRNPAHTFSAPGSYSIKLSAGNLNGMNAVTKTVTVGGGTGGCTPSATTLCLNNSRFRVTAAWRTSDGRSGQGTGVQLTSDSGYFWFFNSANIEVVLKVLNACAVNAHYWVFAAGLTNVEVSLSVTDTSNATVKPYLNPLGTAFQPIQATSAFATCP